MQNKPNFQDTRMNISIPLQMAYENKHNWTLGENKPNQTQSRNNCPFIIFKGGRLGGISL
jgi:hypothetical protein